MIYSPRMEVPVHSWRVASVVVLVCAGLTYSLGQYSGWSSWISFGPDKCPAGSAAFDGCCDEKSSISGDRLISARLATKCGYQPAIDAYSTVDTTD